MSPEALFQIGVRSGILDEKHRKALGYSGLWLFGFLILKQNREGKVNYGRPLTYREISKGSGIPHRSLERIFPRVVFKNGYFEAVRTRDGYKITGVNKQKKFLEATPGPISPQKAVQVDSVQKENPYARPNRIDAREAEAAAQLQRIGKIVERVRAGIRQT